MGEKQKICKWPRERLLTDIAELHDAVAKPRFVCVKCGRAARKKGYLCRPLSLKTIAATKRG